MMEKEILVTIKSRFLSEEGEDVTETSSLGKMIMSDEDKFELEYASGDLSTDEKATTNMKICGNKMVIINRKSDDYNSQLIIEKGKRHLCQYGTEYGNFMLGVSSQYIDNRLTKKGGRLRMKYSLDVNSALASTNEIDIKIMEVAPHD